MKQTRSGWRDSWSGHRWACTISEEDSLKVRAGALPTKLERTQYLRQQGQWTGVGGGTVSVGKLKGCELETESLPHGESGGFILCAFPSKSQWGWRIKWGVLEPQLTLNTTDMENWKKSKGWWDPLRPSTPTVATPFFLPVDIILLTSTSLLKTHVHQRSLSRRPGNHKQGAIWWPPERLSPVAVHSALFGFPLGPGCIPGEDEMRPGVLTATRLLLWAAALFSAHSP